MILDALKTIYTEEQLRINEPMKDHTSFKIGGPANILVLPENREQIVATIEKCHLAGQAFHIMGNGSNILVDDDGINGVVIKISEQMSQIDIQGDRVIVDAGVLLSKLSKVVMRESLKGFEFASGIPGTIGGAVFMNAGAYGGEMKDVVEWVEVLTIDGQYLRLSNEAMAFGYRTSSVKTNDYIVIRVCLKLEKGTYDDILAITKDLTEKRVTKQPLDLPSAGSTFKRPTGHFAGQLIEEAGCRGLMYGDAQVSQKHCGFVVNLGEASCKDVMTLIKTVQKIVLDHSGVALEREVRIFGKE